MTGHDMPRAGPVSAATLAASLLAPPNARSTRNWWWQTTLDLAWDDWTTRESATSFFAPHARIEPQVG